MAVLLHILYFLPILPIFLNLKYFGIADNTHDFQLISFVSCGLSYPRRIDAFTCTSECSKDASCTGVILRGNGACQILINRILKVNDTTDRCLYFLRPRFVDAQRQRNKCPSDFDLKIPSTPDRYFKLIQKRHSDITPQCSTLGAELADLHQGNSLLEMRVLLYNIYFNTKNSFCVHYNFTNIQCNVVIAARTTEDGIKHWIPSKAFFNTSNVYNDYNSKNCSTYFTLTILINGNFRHTNTVLQCVDPSFANYLPLCQCRT